MARSLRDILSMLHDIEKQLPQIKAHGHQAAAKVGEAVATVQAVASGMPNDKVLQGMQKFQGELSSAFDGVLGLTPEVAKARTAIQSTMSGR